jgi:hypothetical protein
MLCTAYYLKFGARGDIEERKTSAEYGETISFETGSMKVIFSRLRGFSRRIVVFGIATGASRETIEMSFAFSTPPTLVTAKRAKNRPFSVVTSLSMI